MDTLAEFLEDTVVIVSQAILDAILSSKEGH